MRRLTGSTDPSHAQLVCDYLLTKGIESQVREPGSEPEHEVWVIDHEELERAKQLLAELDSRDPAEIAHEARAARQDRKRSEKEASSRFVVMRERWRVGENLLRPVTSVLILFSVIVAFLGQLGDVGTPMVQNLLILPPMPLDSGPIEVLLRQPYRLLTPIFIHFGFVHLLFNMMWLHSLGQQIERSHGSLAMGGLVVLALK